MAVLAEPNTTVPEKLDALRDWRRSGQTPCRFTFLIFSSSAAREFCSILSAGYTVARLIKTVSLKQLVKKLWMRRKKRGA